MPKGHALVIGINRVNPNHYAGWDGALKVCEADANKIAAYLKKQKFGSVTKLLTKEATRPNVISALDSLAAKSNTGDLVVVYYSGHGGNEIPDFNKDEDDPWSDRFDETWCLYDAQLIDDELYYQWKKFKKGVRIVVMSDSCFSGDIAKLVLLAKKGPSKAMPKKEGEKTYEKNKKFYNKLVKELDSKELKTFKTNKKGKIVASLLQISSSQEFQTSNAETDQFPKNSLFTAVLFKIIGSAKKIKSYEQLIATLKKSMPDFQMPKEQMLGDLSLKLQLNKPFSI
ncbi:MAG TPA: caspase family protein [Chitinophagaceae bacterium]|nr:caspase family protein [Chitinophagaceae bacterium]